MAVIRGAISVTTLLENILERKTMLPNSSFPSNKLIYFAYTLQVFVHLHMYLTESQSEGDIYL